MVHKNGGIGKMGNKMFENSELQLLIKNPNRFLELESLLISKSNLPGPRGNLGLADAFADCFETTEVGNELWNLLQGWLELPIDVAPTNHPKEFLPFCATLALGAYYFHANEIRRKEIVSLFKRAMGDSRWRMREAVAMGFQRIGETDFAVVKGLFDSWLADSNCLEKRAIVATLAHPPMLKENQNVLYCLDITEQILNWVIFNGKESCSPEDFKVLSKGLEYSISVFVAQEPEMGFALLKKFAAIEDKRIKKIVKSNLGKARLTKKYPEKVNEVLEIL